MAEEFHLIASFTSDSRIGRLRRIARNTFIPSRFFKVEPLIERDEEIFIRTVELMNKRLSSHGVQIELKGVAHFDLDEFYEWHEPDYSSGEDAEDRNEK